MTIYDSNGMQILEVDVDDNSYHFHEIMGDNVVVLYYALPTHTELPVGCYVEVEGSRYYLIRPEDIKLTHSRYFDYTVTFTERFGYAKLWMFHNPVDHRISFSMCAPPKEHLKMIVDNLNEHLDAGELQWAPDRCIDQTERTVTYDKAYIFDALKLIADAFETEFEVVDHTVLLGRMHHNDQDPLPLAYGQGNGLISGVTRQNFGSLPPIGRLYVQGSDRNINPAEYGARSLHMPSSKVIAYDGERFEDEQSYNSAKEVKYQTDVAGTSVARLSVSQYDNDRQRMAEAAVELTDIYPSRVGRVSSVRTVNAAKHLYDITDTTIPDALDYSQYIIPGETMSLIFQDGQLAGREFDIIYHHDPETVTSQPDLSTIINRRIITLQPDRSTVLIEQRPARLIELVPKEQDGQMMPESPNYMPAVGDHYVIFHCAMPREYVNEYYVPPTGATPQYPISNNKRGAEWDLMREAVRYMADRERPQYTYRGTLDQILARREWATIAPKLVLGGMVRFSDPRFCPDGALVRIISVKTYLNREHAPEVELSDTINSRTFFSELRRAVSAPLMIKTAVRQTEQLAARQIRMQADTASLINTRLSMSTEQLDHKINVEAQTRAQALIDLRNYADITYAYEGHEHQPSAARGDIVSFYATADDFPKVGEQNKFYIDESEKATYLYHNGRYECYSQKGCTCDNCPAEFECTEKDVNDIINGTFLPDDDDDIAECTEEDILNIINENLTN